MPQIYDMGPTALLPLRRKACWGFFLPKNPTASAGFEPVNLGTKGQHATRRPPKQKISYIATIKIMEKLFSLRTCIAVINKPVACNPAYTNGCGPVLKKSGLPFYKTCC